MLVIGPIGFLLPWVLLSLIVLPLLWVILRAVPPAPVVRRFPAVALLLGLRDDESQTDRTPWWLLLLRMAALALVIIGFADPVLNPVAQNTETSDDPALVLVDGSWASAAGWREKQARLDVIFQDLSRQGRAAVLVQLTDVPAVLPAFQTALAAKARVAGLRPNPWHADDAAMMALLDTIDIPIETLWLSDGVARQGRDDLLAALQSKGAVQVYETGRQIYGLGPAVYDQGAAHLQVLRTLPGSDMTQIVMAIGPDTTGTERILAQSSAVFSGGDTTATAKFDLPTELRNRISRFAISGQNSAGAISLADDGLRRREVALFSGRAEAEALALLDPLHYLRQALVPSTDLIDGAIQDTVLSNPDVIILADVAQLTDADHAALTKWVAKGGLLVRFAGPRLAASDVSRAQEDGLMPVRLRVGGRSIGGAMSWGAPRRLRPFDETSPFFGLRIPDEVFVTSQVVAEPDPTLSSRVLATLQDGTPLVTRKSVGAGHVVLFHVTASAKWSSLPLSGLFVDMMERLAVSAGSTRPTAQDLEGTTWVAQQVLDGFGGLDLPQGVLGGVAGADLAQSPLSAQIPPGIYSSDKRQIARNVLGVDDMISPVVWPVDVPVHGVSGRRDQRLKGGFLAIALAVLMLDIVASLWLTGRFSGPRARMAAFVVGAVMMAGLLGAGGPAVAQDAAGVGDTTNSALSERDFSATSEVVMGHVLTGNAEIDATARDGLRGLGAVLYSRTSIEPGPPMGVDLETDELSFFPMLYWPITPDQPLPSLAAYDRLNSYLKTGGMILFDTRDAGRGRTNTTSPEARHLQRLARQLDIPPLEPVPADHVMMRSFYLLQDLPGRYVGPAVWVEAAPPDAQQIEGMPFRNLNDGVTPVVVGGNDWAAAWAVDQKARSRFPVGRGVAGERQREVAYRFGVNLMMHVLTGNYKSDQVHVPALLDRLGQ